MDNADQSELASRVIASTLSALSKDVTPTVDVQRSNTAMNDFTNNDVIMYGSYPLSLPLGTGLKKGGSINKYQAVHIIKQWHQELSHAKITFHLFDTWRRHTSAQVVIRRVKNTPDSLKQFGELIRNDSLQPKLLRA